MNSAAADAGLTPAGPLGEVEANSARLDLLELVLDAMAAGTLSPADGRAVAWRYAATPVSDAEAAARCGATPGAWQRRRSRAVDRLKSSLQLRPAA